MKLLFDQNLSFKLCRALNDIFPESSQVRLVDLDTARDDIVWNYAGSNGYVLVTLDADFAEIAALRGPPPKVIWLRTGNQTTSTVESIIRRHAEILYSFEKDTTACLEMY